MSWTRKVCIRNNYVVRGPFNASGCDQRHYYDNITVGKVYEVLNFKNGNYWIWDDNGNQRGLPTECFTSVEAWRNYKIDTILNVEEV
jgi:hypothetical protein